MLMWVSSEDWSAVKASLMVAEIEREVSGGLPRQRSETSCANNRAAIHRLVVEIGRCERWCLYVCESAS